MQTVAILLLVLATPLQRIESQYPDPAKVIRVETAMNHLTIIELKEPVTLAAVGSPSFKIERRENKVFIQPLEEGASTNLFVWTNSGRLNYELVPATSIETMHFVIDQQGSASLENQDDAAVSPADFTPKQSIADEMFLFAKPIRNRGVKASSNKIGVFITDVYRKDDQLFIRYMIDNRTAHPYPAGEPEVFSVESASPHTALNSYRYSQVGPDFEKKIHGRAQLRIVTVECDVPSEPLPPGEAATGILILHAPPAALESEPSVLRIVFPAAGRQAASVTLVL